MSCGRSRSAKLLTIFDDGHLAGNEGHQQQVLALHCFDCQLLLPLEHANT